MTQLRGVVQQICAPYVDAYCEAATEARGDAIVIPDDPEHYDAETLALMVMERLGHSASSWALPDGSGWAVTTTPRGFF